VYHDTWRIRFLQFPRCNRCRSFPPLLWLARYRICLICACLSPIGRDYTSDRARSGYWYTRTGQNCYRPTLVINCAHDQIVTQTSPGTLEARQAVRKNQFNGVSGLRTYLSFTLIGVHRRRKPAGWEPATRPQDRSWNHYVGLMKRSWNKRRLLDLLDSKLGCVKMIEAVTAILVLFSAGIFVAHTVDAYRAP